LALIVKSDMRQFDAADDSGASVPVLATNDNARLSLMFIELLLRAETGTEPTVADHDDIERIIRGVASQSWDLAEQFVRRRGLAMTLTQQYLFLLVDNFILFVLLPIDRAGDRTVGKLSYQWDTEPRPAGRAWLTDRFWRAIAAVGWHPYEFGVELGGLTTAASSHLEVPAPPGLHCVDLVLYAGDDVVAADTEPGSVAHVHTTVEKQATYGVVRFDPDLAGLHRIVTWSSWGVSTLLLATYWRLDQVASDPGTPVSLLLFGPALLLTLLVRPGESWIVSAVVGPLRTLAVMLAAFLFAIAFGVSTGFHPAPHSTFVGQAADVAWRTAIGVSVVSGIILTVGRLSVRSRQKRRCVHHG
jgi:hypothetical protein